MLHQDMAANAVLRDQMFDTSSQGLVDAPTAIICATLSKVCGHDCNVNTKTFREPSRAGEDVGSTFDGSQLRFIVNISHK